MEDRRVIPTPIGSVEVVTRGRRLRAMNLTDLTRRFPVADIRNDAIDRALIRYFEGEPNAFKDLRLDLDDCTAFERTVYAATRAIPFGNVATYGQIANAIGKPGAARGVGRALGRNPISIVIPCHRVVASDGLGGFTGGIQWKRRLLRHEHMLSRRTANLKLSATRDRSPRSDRRRPRGRR